MGESLSVTEFSDLPPLLRVRRYLDMAGDARRQAALTKGAARQSFIFMAEQWERLATDVTERLKSNLDSN